MISSVVVVVVVLYLVLIICLVVFACGILLIHQNVKFDLPLENITEDGEIFSILFIIIGRHDITSRASKNINSVFLLISNLN